MQKKVLIVTQDNGDPHIQAVCKELEALGQHVIIFNRYSENNYVSYFYDDKNSYLTILIDDNAHEISTDTIKGVFWRPKPFLTSEVIGESGSLNERFRMHEWRFALDSINEFCYHSRWINPIKTSKKIVHKPTQLKLALEKGLNIPKTIVSNSSNDILNHLQNTDSIIYKTLSSFITFKQVIYTTPTNLKDIENNSESIFLAPGIFQEEINKQYELRVTVVGNEIFTVKIDSQSLLETKLDWRRNQTKSIMSSFDLSEKTKRNLLAFHNDAGLEYCAYDFIVDKSGEEIFLEANPSGQWLFLCDEVSDKINKAIAFRLCA